MFEKPNQNEKSPRTVAMLNNFIQKSKNNEPNKTNNIYMNQNVNLNNNNYNDFYNNNNTTNNKLYNINTVSQGNKSIMTTSQILDISLANDELKRKKNIGILDVTSHRNKNIFIESDSEQYNSRKNSEEESNRKKRKRCCSKLIVDKVTSQEPYYIGKGKINNNILPDNLYSIRTNNDINLNELNDDINSHDTYEYEKSEIIKIRKVNYLPTDPRNTVNNNNGNRIEEKRIKLKNKNKTPFHNNKNDLNNMNNLNNQRRTNNISNSSADYKYPFVIPTTNKNNPEEVYYQPVNSRNTLLNNKQTSTDSSNNYDYNNQYISKLDNSDNISITENSDVVTPLKQNPYAFRKKRIYGDNDRKNNYNVYPYNLKLYNNRREEEPQYNADNNVDSDTINSYRDNPDKKYYNYDSKFKTLYLKKEKEYNNLLEDYNDVVAKYNKLQGLYNKLYNDRDNDTENEEKNKDNNDADNEVKNCNKLMDNIFVSPMKSLAASKSENNMLNNIYKVEPVEDRLQNLIYDNNDKDYKDKDKDKLNNFSSNLKIEQNENVFILNEKNDISNKFNEDNLHEEKNNIIQLNFEYKSFDENKFDINKTNEINI